MNARAQPRQQTRKTPKNEALRAAVSQLAKISLPFNFRPGKSEPLYTSTYTVAYSHSFQQPDVASGYFSVAVSL
jgi:hypothetical protein